MIVDLEHLTAELKLWYEHSGAKAINLVSVPYRGVGPLTGLLEGLIGRIRILYISGPASPEDSLSSYLEERAIAYATWEDPAADIVILDCEAVFLAGGSYDLVIYDDLNSFPAQRKGLMQELISYLYPRCGRLLAYSLEPVLRGVKTLELPLKQDRSFVTEPRFLDLKTDISQCIPSTLYEYIDFFFNDGRPVVIFVPDGATGQGMMTYLGRINPALTDHLHVIDAMTDAEVQELLGGGAAILFSSQLRDLRGIPRNFEFIVVHSEQARFEYRQFVFLCLRSGLFDDVNGEVILLSGVMTHDMDRAKELTQNFNRVIWESDQLSM